LSDHHAGAAHAARAADITVAAVQTADTSIAAGTIRAHRTIGSVCADRAIAAGWTIAAVAAVEGRNTRRASGACTDAAEAIATDRANRTYAAD
jgi:hypothetical protein